MFKVSFFFVLSILFYAKIQDKDNERDSEKKEELKINRNKHFLKQQKERTKK